ncbi:AraC family transcriptional regulator [Danxiaibacter flavus]|uniref:AraC family transcriptional regulator n=1 Tax=Danxiaibacter flavus TaxID=3049108 RepID=A0ABV3ZDW7_9BACT|nr:AraC family transcriptional regulator [Chitinophagaceae bacterium DXS]
MQFPKDIIARYCNTGVRRAEMKAVVIPADNSFKGGDVLQTMHCLELVISGNLHVRYNDELIKIEKDDIQFRKRGNYIIHPSIDYSAILFFMDDEFIRDFIKEIDIFSKETFTAELPPFVFKSSAFINHSIEESIGKIKRQEVFTPCIVKLTALQAMFHIFSNEPSRTFATYLRFLVSERKIDLSYFMETNFSQNMSLEEMAKLTGRSLSTFKKEFSELYNDTPQKWLINRRLQHAHYLLKETNQPVTQIAYDCGFENNSHFSKAYRTKYGVAPTSSRAQLQ